MKHLLKYPRTQHLTGSRLMPGDEDLNAVPFAAIANRHIVVEEKVDGANAGISFDENGKLWLQSRGHYLTGGYGERHFALFKQWANHHGPQWNEVIGSRYIVYGEWLYAKHTVFYDALPHYFMEFDVYDRESESFLSTARRQALLAPLAMTGVRVLHEGPLSKLDKLISFLGKSPFKTERHRDVLQSVAAATGLDGERALRETDATRLMEGLYIKVEENGQVLERYKYVRADFQQTLLASDSHWQSRPIIPNQLRADADLFAFRSYEVAT